MELKANMDRRMTPERAEAIKAFVRQTGESSSNTVNDQTASLRNAAKRPSMSESEANRLGKELVEGSAKQGVDTVKIHRLIREGANVNSTNDYGFTALMYASQDGYVAVVEALLNNGADVNLKNVYNHNSMDYAIGTDRIEIVELLIHGGVDVNAPTGKIGMTPLMCASKYGDYMIVDALLSNGADANIIDGNGKKAVDYTEDRDIKMMLEAAMQAK